MKNIKIDFINKFIKSIEDNCFLYNNDGEKKNVEIRLIDNKEIHIIGKDCDDSEEVLNIIYIEDELFFNEKFNNAFPIIITKEGISLRDEFLWFNN